MPIQSRTTTWDNGLEGSSVDLLLRALVAGLSKEFLRSLGRFVRHGQAMARMDHLRAVLARRIGQPDLVLIVLPGRISRPASFAAAAWSIRVNTAHPPAAFALMSASNFSTVSLTVYLLGLTDAALLRQSLGEDSYPRC